MKNRLTILSVVFLFGALGLSALGCSSSETPDAQEDAVAYAAPAFQPADHEGRFESGGGAMCVGCHDGAAGGGAQAPIVIPESHYLSSDSGEQELDPTRMQCITCHPVTE